MSGQQGTAAAADPIVLAAELADCEAKPVCVQHARSPHVAHSIGSCFDPLHAVTMSLYGDFAVVPGEKPANPASLSSIKLLQDHLRLKQRDKRDINKKRPSHRPATSFKTESALLPAFIADDVRSTGSLLGGDWDVSQEYDPFKPNDYEKIVREKREERRRNEQVIQVTAKKRLVGPYTSDDEDDESALSSPSTNPHATTPAKVGAAIPPPKDLTTCSEPGTAAVIAGNAGISTTAAKIMMKMGYKEGSGLGKEEQGMAKPLEAIKTGKKQGVITHGLWSTDKDFAVPPVVVKEQFLQPPTPSTSTSASTGTDESKKITEMMRNPTRVVLLTNMVGPGEVDDDLEPETKEECGKYGEVVKCVIFEIPGPAVKAEDAVRIFVEFKRVESAIKAVVDLNGRFFGGRTVRASFYDLDRFRNFDLIDVK